MEFKGAGEVGVGLKGLHSCLLEVAEAVLCRRAFGNPTAPLDGLCLWADRVTFGIACFYQPDTLVSLFFRAQGTPVLAAAAVSMGFHATQAVKTATKWKMVALILTQPHMYISEQQG